MRATLSEEPGWKSAFYGAYVSSGQALIDTASVENLFQPRLNHLKHLIAQHIPPDRNARILDLGCGAGALLYALDLAGYRNLAGVDVSAEQIAVAARMGVTSASCETLEVFLAAQPAASVDVVLAIDIFEHMTRPELMEVLVSIRRVLTPGGRCVAHVPNAEGIYGMEIRFGDFTHELAFTRVSAAQVFHIAGFREVRCFEEKPVVHGIKSLVRRAIWDLGTLPGRLLHIAETGGSGIILSQNMMIEAIL